MSEELKGKVAIITGGANGIGRATAQLFAAEGARIIIADVDEVRGGQLAASIGEHARFQRTDVSCEQDIQDVVDLAVSQFGRLDIMFNNAGLTEQDMSPLLTNTFDGFHDILAVNLFGVMIGTQHAARHMAENGGGSIINTSSIAGIHAGFGFFVYRAAKAGVVNFTQASAIELGEHRIRVNCICPGNIPTDMGKHATPEPGMSEMTAQRIRSSVDAVRMVRQALKRQGSPADVAEAAVFLASDRSRQITGLIMPVDAGTSAGDAVALMPEILAARAAAIAG